MESEKVKHLIDMINEMDIKDKLRLAICVSQSYGLIYNTKENYEKFDTMLKEVEFISGLCFSKNLAIL